MPITPEISNELGGDGVKKLRSDRNTKVGKIVLEQARMVDTLVDLEGAVEVWIIDQTGPSNSRAWFPVNG